MALDIGEALSEGFNRTTERNGLMLAGLFVITSLLNAILSQTMAKGAYSNVQTAAMQPTPLALPISPSIAGILWLPVVLLSLALGIAAIRTLVSNETETIPTDNFKRNILMAGLNLIVGGIVFAILVGLGFLLLVIPGFYLLTALYFWTVFVVVEDQNFIEAFKSSWNMTEDNRLMLFLLGVVVVVLGLVASIPAAIVSIGGALAGLSVVGTLATQITSGFVSVFTIATMAEVYRQLA